MCRRSSHPSNSFLKQHEASALTTLAMSVWGIPDGIPEGRAVEDGIPFFWGLAAAEIKSHGVWNKMRWRAMAAMG